MSFSGIDININSNHVVDNGATTNSGNTNGISSNGDSGHNGVDRHLRPSLRDSNPGVQSSLTFISQGMSGYDLDDPGHVLFELVESAIAELDEDYNYAERWDAVRKWLLDNEDDVDLEDVISSQYNCAYLQDVGGYSHHKLSCLHLLCSHPNPPMDVMKIFLMEAQIAVAQGDGMRLLPLSHACLNNVDYEIVKLLIEEYPEGVHNLDANGASPLHLLISRNDFRIFTKKDASNMTQIVKLLCEHGAAEEAQEGMYSIHFACAFGCPSSVVRVLIDYFPHSVHKIRDSQGRTSLHYAMSNAVLNNSNQNVQVLLDYDPNIVNMYDHKNKIPLHSYLTSLPRNLQYLKEDKNQVNPEEEKQKMNVKACLDVYLKGNPLPTPFFISTLNKLPIWLKDFAVSQDSVKDMLNKKIIQRVPTFILIFDLMIYFLVVFYLRRGTRKYINGENDIHSASLFSIASAWFAVRELMQAFSSIALRSFGKWYSDLGNILDVVFFILLMFLAVKFDTGPCEQEADCEVDSITIKTMFLICTVLVYTNILRFLTSVRVDFSVFVNGLLFTFKNLTTFMIIIFTMLLIFAFIFNILFAAEKECGAFCTLTHSFIRNIQGLSGEVDPGPFSESIGKRFFFVLYVFLLTILLVNFLIAIIVDSYGIIQNERANVVFWSERLNYVSEIDGLTSIFRRLFGQKEIQNVISVDDVGAESWDALMGTFRRERENNFFKQISIYFKRFFALNIIVLWIVVGLFSIGLLWPPQVRDYLLSNKKSSQAKNKNDIVEEVSMHITELRKEIYDMKSTSKKLRKEDRNRLLNVKEDAESLQKSVLEDMSQIKDIMKTLLELRRQQYGLDS